MVAQVVTSENLKDFNAAKLGLSREAAPVTKPADGETKPAKAETKPVIPDTKPANGETDPKPGEEESADKKGGLNERMKTLARERNEARQALETARREVEEARQALESTRRASEGVKGKAKPQAADFKDAFDYAEALADWKLEEKWGQKQEAERKELARLQAERVQRTWTANVKKTAAEIADYKEVVADANIPLTNELRDAILESELGPRIKYYLAKNPEEVDRLTSMTVRGMERAFGKLEMMIEEQMAKQQHKTDDGLPAVKLGKPKPEAPEPISPIVATGVGAAQGVVDVNGNVVGSYKDYKAARRAGKIR